MEGTLGKESRDRPATACRRLVAEAVVEAVVAVLPELPRVSHDAIAAPRLRARWCRACELLLELRNPLLEGRARLERLALLRGERADLPAARARREVRVRLVLRQSLDRSLDPHLPAERRPVEEERSAR